MRLITPKALPLLLAVLAAYPLLFAFELNTWEVLRLLFISAGLAWLAFQKAKVLDTPFLHGPLLVFLVCAFVFSQFSSLPSALLPGHPYLIRGLILILAGSLVLVWLLAPQGHGPVLAFGRVDRYVSVGALALILVSLFTQFTAAWQNAEPLSWRQAQGALDILLLGLLYFTLSRLPWSGRSRLGSISFALRLNALVLGSLALVGVYRISAATYYLSRAEEGFLEGNFQSTAMNLTHLQEINHGLGDRYKKIIVLEHLADLARTRANSAQAFEALGTLNAEAGCLSCAADMYQQSLAHNPNFSGVRQKLGMLYLEFNYWDLAAKVYREGLSAKIDEKETYLGLGVALAKQFRWDEANQILFEAFRNSDLAHQIEQHRNSNGYAVFTLRDLPLQNLKPFLDRLTLYEYVELLQERGWSVFYHSMEVGSTGVVTPCNILATSKGGHGYEAGNIKIDTHEISPRRAGSRPTTIGYNLVWLNSKTGNIEDSINCNTWDDRYTELHALVNFIGAVPDGDIVIVTVAYDAGSEWVKRYDHTDRKSGVLLQNRIDEALGKIGVQKKADSWWSHAAIGVKGANPGMALEVIAKNDSISNTNSASVGVLKGNIRETSKEEITRFLLSVLRDNPEVPVALFLDKNLSESIIAIQKSRM